MATKQKTKNTRQMVLLAALLIVLAYYVLHTFVFTGSTSRSTGATQARNPSSTPRSGGTGGGRQGAGDSGTVAETNLQQLLDDRSPLELRLLAHAGGGPVAPSPRGNIFEFYVEPIKPPPPPPPEPPIKLSYLQPQTAVAGTPRSIKLAVTGSPFPQDAQILINGTPRPSKRINETTLTTDIGQGEYSGPRTFTVEVKSQADPAVLNSNPLSFVVVPSPEPPFKYVGRIGDVAIIETGMKEFARLTRGSTIQGVWRIEAISDAGVEVIHTQYEIRKRVAMQDKGR